MNKIKKYIFNLLIPTVASMIIPMLINQILNLKSNIISKIIGFIIIIVVFNYIIKDLGIIKRITSILMIFIGITLLFGNAIISDFKNPMSEIEGKINFPTNDQEVSAKDGFKVNGTIYNVPRGYYAWIILERNGVLYPKKPINVDSLEKINWEEEIGDDRPRPFKIKLSIVDEEGNNTINSWINDCKKSNTWTGLKEITNESTLYVIENVTPANRKSDILDIGEGN